MVEANQANFKSEVLESKTPVLVDFWAPWCMPCKIVAPAVEKIAEDMSGKLKVMKTNVDDSPEVATEHSVMNIPTLILFRDGKEVFRIVGVNSKEAIEAKLRANLG